HTRFSRDWSSDVCSSDLSQSMPGWPRYWKINKRKQSVLSPIAEKDYNKGVARSRSGFLVLDRKLIRTLQHPKGIESCDLLGPDDELIHVKRLDDSVSASHLFNQAVVSAEALVYQDDARSALRALV